MEFGLIIENQKQKIICSVFCFFTNDKIVEKIVKKLAKLLKPSFMIKRTSKVGEISKKRITAVIHVGHTGDRSENMCVNRRPNSIFYGF